MVTGCKDKKPTGYQENIPDSPVFEKIAEFVKNKGESISDATLPDYDMYYTMSFNPAQTGLHQYDILYSSSKNKLALWCDEFLKGGLYFEKSLDKDYANSPIILHASLNLNEQEPSFINKYPVIYTVEYNYKFTIILQPTKYAGSDTTLTLPDFNTITKQKNGISDELEVTAENKVKVKEALQKAYVNILTVFNHFYIEKIQNNNTAYKDVIYKYFYLPIILKI